MESDLPYLDKLLQSLIGCYPCYLSDGSGIVAAQSIVRGELEAIGFKVTEADVSVEEIRSNPHYVRVEEWGSLFKNYSPTTNPSLIGSLEINKNIPTLALNGHVDVEPVFEPSMWKYPELWRSGKLLDNKFYGRGSTDMLGGVVGMLFCLKHILGSSTKPKTNLLFHSVSDEEIGGNGTLRCLIKGPKPDWVVIAEPTGSSVCTSSLGFHHFSIKCIGTSVHMSQSQPGQNAIDNALEAYKRITSLRQFFSKLISSTLGFERLKINPIICGRIMGGKDPAVPAEFCILEGVVFSSPLQTASDVKKILERTLYDSPIINTSLTMTSMSFSGAISDDKLITETLIEAGKLLNYNIVTEGFPSPCDMRLYTSHGVPTSIFGPGYLSNAHSANESLDRNELIKFCKIFTIFLTKFWDKVS